MSTESFARLSLLETSRELRIARGGRLQPWLGPAIRGLAGGRLKARVCRQTVAEQVNRWIRCTGCPLRGGCAYGETIEGEPPDTTPADGDAIRPLVIAPHYPCPELARVGDRIPVQVTFIGNTAAIHAPVFWETLRIGGADPGLGLGEDWVLFDVLPAQPDRSEEIRLPWVLPAGPENVPWVRIVLTSPLVLKTREGDGKRRLIDQPTLAHLLGRWESLACLFHYDGTTLPDATITQLKELVRGVPLLRQAFHLVSQTKSSHRTNDRWEAKGVIGWGMYGPVPVSVLPWLRWAGRLHIGNHRVAGAGGWRVELP